MGTVKVSFLGVCTVFRDLPPLVPPGVAAPPSRVVLPRASEAFTELLGVDPHFGKVQFVADQISISGPALPPADSPTAPNTYGLFGATLKIANATASPTAGLSPDRGLDCLPSLQAHLDVDLGVPERFVYEHDADNAHAWFDLEAATAFAYLLKPYPPCPIVPSITVMTIETDGAPVLTYDRWDGGGTTSVMLSNVQADEPAGILVMNFALGEGVVDNNSDFRLHYRCAAAFPPVCAISIPEFNACRFQSPGDPYVMPRCGDAGPGCSNSTYP